MHDDTTTEYWVSEIIHAAATPVATGFPTHDAARDWAEHEYDTVYDTPHAAVAAAYDERTHGNAIIQRIHRYNP